MLLMRNIDHQTKADGFMNALTRQVTGCQSVITPKTGHVKFYVDDTEKSNIRPRGSSKTSYKLLISPSVTPRVEHGAVTPGTSISCKTDWMKNVDTDANVALSEPTSGDRAPALHSWSAMACGTRL